ncbi:hypothetical protein, variant, partial [Aphanomyces invadans]
MEIFASAPARDPPRQDTPAGTDAVKVDAKYDQSPEELTATLLDGQTSDLCDIAVEAKRAKVADDVEHPHAYSTNDASTLAPSSVSSPNDAVKKIEVGESNAISPQLFSADVTSLAMPEPTSIVMNSKSPGPKKDSISWMLTKNTTVTTSLTIEALMERFREERMPFLINLKASDRVDIKCYKYRQWFAAKVIKVSDRTIKIHFNGFKKDYTYDRFDYMHIAPQGTYVERYDPSLGAKWKPQPSAIDADLGGLTYIPEKKQKNTQVPKRARPTPPNKEAIAGEVIKKSVSRSRATPIADPFVDKQERLVADSLPVIIKPSPSKRLKTELKLVPSDPFKAKGISRDELPLWLAPTKDAEGTEYVLCDGPCLGSYHLGCVGLSSDDKLPDEWKCDSCVSHEYECLICHKFAIAGEALVKCALEHCGKFYHPECLVEHPHTQVGHKHKTLVCPRHTCDNCSGKKGSEGLMKCMYCATAYHPLCIPPSCRFNNYAMVCGRDKAKKLPSIPDFFGPDKIVFDGKFKFPDIFLPKLPPPPKVDDEAEVAAAALKLQQFQFRLPMAYLDESNAPPPRFQKLRRNQYQFKPIKLDMNDLPMCQCKDKCDEDCTNRAAFVECIGNTGDKKEKHFNCRVGPDCGNRALQIAAIPKTKVFKTTNGRGFGLRVLEPVKAGALVIEYVGEVITAWMKQDRMIAHAETSPNDPNYYIMELDKNVYLDGRVKGSDSRFINHSCDPNCHLLKWEVGEYKRIAITALRDIEADEELSYDYQMETTSTESFKCHCGALRCRGTMAPDNLNKEAHAKLKLEEDNAKKLDKKNATKKRKRTTTRPAMAAAVEPPSFTSKSSSRRHLAAATDESDIKQEESPNDKSEDATATNESPTSSSDFATTSDDGVPTDGTTSSTATTPTRVDQVMTAKPDGPDNAAETSEEDASPARPSGDVTDLAAGTVLNPHDAKYPPKDIKAEAAVVGEPLPMAPINSPTTL